MSDDEITITQALPLIRDLPADASPDDHADAAGLVYVSDDEPGWTRVGRGKGFSYHREDGSLIDGPERARIEALAIPPAWTEVWICPDPKGHIQATGRDDAGRKQYRYHERWRGVRDATKFHRMSAFGDALPGIRDAVDADLRTRSLSREKILAVVTALLDETLVRVGNDEYARTNESFGLTTLRGEHLKISGSTIHLSFPGKSGREQEVQLRHRRLARQLLKIEEIDQQEIFAWRTDDGAWQDVKSHDVNRYIAEVSGDSFTAKDFRTWGGTVVAAQRLHDLGPAESARTIDANILEAVDAAAEALGNTRAVARSSYVHPLVPKAYRFQRFDDQWDDDPGEVERLTATERAVRRVLRLDLPPSADLEATLAASLETARQQRDATNTPS